jgi:large subunit ribosomal protein L25
VLLCSPNAQCITIEKTKEGNIMTEIVKFNIESKEHAGKSTAKQLRKLGNVPATIYGDNQAPEMFSLSLNDFAKEYQKGGIRTRLAELDLAGRKISAIVKEVQLHPVTDHPLHIDFLRVGKDTTVKVAVPVRISNEDKSPGVKKGGIVNLVHRKIDFVCHPSKVPAHIDVSIEGMEIGQNVHINDLKLAEGVTPLDTSNFTVLSIMGRTEEEANPAAAVAAAS